MSCRRVSLDREEQGECRKKTDFRLFSGRLPPSLPPYVWFLPPTSQTPPPRGRSEQFYVKDSTQNLKMRRQSSTVGVRNRQRKTSQQALVHSKFTLTLLALVQTTAAASRCGTTRRSCLCWALATNTVSSSQRWCQQINKWLTKPNYVPCLCGVDVCSPGLSGLSPATPAIG